MTLRSKNNKPATKISKRTNLEYIVEGALPSGIADV